MANEKFADEKFVFIFSDANLQRYGISPKRFARALTCRDSHNVKSFVIFIASFDNEAQEIQNQLPNGRAFSCFDTKDLPIIFKEIFTSNVLNN